MSEPINAVLKYIQKLITKFSENTNTLLENIDNIIINESNKIK